MSISALKRSDRQLVIWLFSGCFLVFAMVVVGGITRLTGSGLSITEWNLIMGSVPPLNETDWQRVFEKYQASPQFQKQNFHFALHDFKKIFWWEYIHRLLGRLIGIVFIIPFIWFLIKKQISRKLLPRLIFVFLLGGLQGFIGWYMVKSGLVDNPRVSHYRLATHLITAFITFGFIFWTALNIIYPERIKTNMLSSKLFKNTMIFFILVLIQIIYGAFVAGLKAGHFYNTFPKMGDEWVASSVGMALANDGLKSFAENMASIQFFHRYLAFALVIFYVVILFQIRKNEGEKILTKQQRSAVYALGLILSIQFLLGVFTLIYSVPVILGVFHQVGAFFLFSSVIFLLHRLGKSGKQAELLV